MKTQAPLEVRALVAATLLAARLMPHDYEVDASQIRVAVEAADRLLGALDPEEAEAASPEALATTGLVPEGEEPLPASRATPQPLDLTDEERAALPPIEGSPEAGA